MNTIQKRKIVRTFAFILACVLCFSTPFTFETHAEDLKQKQQELESDLSKMNKDKAALGKELSSAAKGLNTLVEEIRATRNELDLAKAREVGQYEMMKKRIQYMYEASSGNFFTMLLESQSMADFLNRADFITTVSQYDRDMLVRLQTIHKEIESKEAELLAQQKEMEQQQAALNASYNQLTSMIRSTSSELADYKAQIAAAEAAKKAAEEAKKENENSLSSGQNNESSDSSASDGNTAKPDTGKDENTNSQEKPSKPEEKPSQPEEKPSKPSEPQKPSDNTELALFAAILECEAGSTNYDGLLAVATVIMNRKASPKYPNTITGVIYQKGQFSPTWTGKLDKVLQRGAKPLCYTVARDALNGARLAAVANCYQFRASWTGHSGTVIGGNVFF